jgi:hypothetical protein
MKSYSLFLPIRREEDHMKTSARTAVKLASASVGALALLGAGYLARNWARYGKVSRDGRPDPLLDRFMPTYEVREYHETRVAAPVEIAFDAVRALDVNRSRLARGIFRARQIALRAHHSPRMPSRPFLEEAKALGWGVLAEAPGREIVFGAVTRPWMANVRFESIPPGDFSSFDTPGFVKIAFTMAAEPVDARSSVVWTETRVATTDAYARDRFRRYWAVVSPGVRVIRIQTLRLVRADAERRAREPHDELMEQEV